MEQEGDCSKKRRRTSPRASRGVRGHCRVRRHVPRRSNVSRARGGSVGLLRPGAAYGVGARQARPSAHGTRPCRVPGEQRPLRQPRVHAELHAEHGVGRKRMARLMRAGGPRARPRRRYVVTTQSRHQHRIAPTLVARKFEVTSPNQVWVSDLPANDDRLRLPGRRPRPDPRGHRKGTPRTARRRDSSGASDDIYPRRAGRGLRSCRPCTINVRRSGGAQ